MTSACEASLKIRRVNREKSEIFCISRQGLEEEHRPLRKGKAKGERSMS